MKDRKVVYSEIMHYLVHNGFVFTVLVMGLVHAVLLLLMCMAGVVPLIQFNILSVIVYAFCFLLCKTGYIMPVYISILLEVTVYTVVSTIYIGLSCGTFCFLFSIVPIIIYFGCYLFKGYKRWIIVMLLLINFSVFVYIYSKFSDSKPLIDVQPEDRLFLALFSTFVMVFSIVFYNVIYIYASENLVGNLEKRNKQLSADAQEDALTNLLNRRGFLPLLEPLSKDDESPKYCVAFCDIDNFKRINDSHGHDAGDEVLRHVSSFIKKEMQGCDICRWGGEEIVILMKDLNFDAAKEKMEGLRKSIESSPTVFFNQRIFVTITIGLAENKEKYKDPEEVIKAADERMYYGKQHGKNILVFEDK